MQGQVHIERFIQNIFCFEGVFLYILDILYAFNFYNFYV